MIVAFNVQLLFDTKEHTVEVPGFITRRVLPQEQTNQIIDKILVDLSKSPANNLVNTPPKSEKVNTVSTSKYKTLKDITLGKKSPGEKMRAYFTARTKKGQCLRCDRHRMKNRRLCTTHYKQARDIMLRIRKQK